MIARSSCLVGAVAFVTVLALTACGSGAAPASRAAPTAESVAPTAQNSLVSAPASTPSAATPNPPPAASAAPTLAPAPSEAPAATSEPPVAAEQNPPGDIPDTQVFVTYTASPGGYSLDVPEGWARSIQRADVRFVNKLDGLSVALAPAQAAPTAASARDHEVAAFAQAGRAVTVGEVKDVVLPGGAAVLFTSTANSDPDPVTGKQVRLEQNTYLFFKNGMLATLTLWAPLGADNVDQWQRIAESFRWK